MPPRGVPATRSATNAGLSNTGSRLPASWRAARPRSPLNALLSARRLAHGQNPRIDHHQRRARRVPLRAAADLARRAARRAQPDGQQGRLQLGRLRRLHRHLRRQDRLLVSDARRRGRRPRHHDGRGHCPRRSPAPGAAEVPRARRAAMRVLHAGVHRRGEGVARREFEPDRGRDPLLACRQSLPVHRLRQDHSRRARRRRGHARGGRIMSYLEKESLKIVGTRPIRPDGVDKVTGRANFGADMKMPGMLWGKIKRSPHAHACIVSINTEKAMALPGVKAVTTRADFPDIPPDKRSIGAMPHNLWDLSRNCMAKGKALYEGHAVAAVAATSPAIAEEALDLIEVEYEVLPHVMDVEAAMAPDAPVLHDDIFTAGIEPKPAKPSNVSKMVRFAKGDIDAGFAEADVVIERRYTTKPVHQAYIEPHACVVSVAPDGQTTIWSSSQGQFMVRAYTSRIAGAEDNASIRAIPAEIGGGFGGKTIIYLEPVAYILSKKSGRPVKIVMSREEVFRATGPTSGAVVEVRWAPRGTGRITAAKSVLKYQSGAFPGSPVQQGCICGLAVYDLPNAETIGYDVLSNRPKVAAYRAPGAPIGSFGVESCIDELAHELGIDPLKMREINGAKDGTKATHGPTWNNIGYMKTVEAAKAHPQLSVPLGPNQGRGIASGYWHNAGGESSAACHVNEDGTVTVTEGH